MKKREPRFRKYACVRAGARANMCSGAKLAELEPNAGIFDFCGHARNFWRDSIEPINRGMQLRRYLPSSLFHCRKIDGKKKKNKQNAATLPGTRIAAIEIARWYEPDVFHHHIYLFIRFLFSLFGLVCFLPSFVLFLFRCHTGMQPLNQIKRGILCTPDDFSRNACARRSLPVSLIENNNEDKCVDARAIKVCADLE